jgi:hypothetical protein
MVYWSIIIVVIFQKRITLSQNIGRIFGVDLIFIYKMRQNVI